MPQIFQGPTWLNPRGPTAAESYARGFALGEERRQANQRAALQQQQMMMQAAAQAQAQAQRTAQAQAELAQEVKKQEEYAAVAQEELAIKKQAQQQKDQEAALDSADILTMQKEISEGGAVPDVMAKHPRVWARRGASAEGLASFVRALNPAPAVQPRIMTIPGSGTTPDTDVMQVGPNQWKMIPNPKTTPERMGDVDKAVLGQTVKDLSEAKKERAKLDEGTEFMKPDSQTLKDRQKDIAVKDKKIADLTRQMEGMRKGGTAAPAKAASGSIRLRRKSDGKTFSYRGKREDVPDTYEILE